MLLRWMILAALLILTSQAALADGVILDGQWTFFGWNGGDGAPAFGNPYQFTSANWTLLRITDMFNPGDSFIISDANTGGVLLTTPEVLQTPAYDCGADADTCYADANMSRAFLYLAPGTYSLNFILNESPFDGGFASFAVGVTEVPNPPETVPEPATLALLATGATAAWARKKFARKN